VAVVVQDPHQLTSQLRLKLEDLEHLMEVEVQVRSEEAAPIEQAGTEPEKVR